MYNVPFPSYRGTYKFWIEVFVKMTRQNKVFVKNLSSGRHVFRSYNSVLYERDKNIKVI